MKTSGTCPKCQSREIAEMKSDSLGARIPTGVLSLAAVSYYVCCRCGYTEEWVTNPDDLKKIADNRK